MNSIAMSDDHLLSLRRTARQLVFRTGAEGTPISLGGTYFFVRYRDHLFAITAKHVVGDALPEQLLLATNDKSWIPARILHQFTSTEETSGALDLVVYELDVRHLTGKHRRASWAFNLLPSEPSWMPIRHESQFFLFGYPRIHSTVDYGVQTTHVESQQWFVTGSYSGESELPHCHALRLAEPGNILDLDGFSGAPVFSHYHLIGMSSRPLFAGVALRGSIASRLVHFLDAEAVRTVLKEIIRRPRKALPTKWRSLKTKKRRSPREHR